MQNKRIVVVGLGVTGISCARFLARQGLSFSLLDSRTQPPRLAAVKDEFPDVDLELGTLDSLFINTATDIILSPGVALEEPSIQAAKARGAQVYGDIDLFCLEAQAPIIAVTGSNGKSTVVSLVAAMAEKAGLNVALGGNLGIPSLDLLNNKHPVDLYILELSSFQLELCHNLQAEVVCLLNISPDHMDRYTDIDAYIEAKQRIFHQAKTAVVNLDEAASCPTNHQDLTLSKFHLSAAKEDIYGLAKDEKGQPHLAFKNELLLPLSVLKIRGQHNVANALASLAIGAAVNLPQQSMLQALQRFTGLKHRCQWVAEQQSVTYINDSKGTNLGATLAAIEGLGEGLDQSKIILIAGGVAKSAEFSALGLAAKKYLRNLVVFGEAANALITAARPCPSYKVSSMQDAVRQAQTLAQSGDIILLSPACASFDMFANFEARGDAFIAAVEGLSC